MGRAWLTCREQLVASAIELEAGGRCAVAAAKSQQAGGAISQIKEPLLEGVVCCTAHQQGLTREEVQRRQGAIMSILHTCIMKIHIQTQVVHQ